MVDFSLTEEQQRLRETARDFAARELRPVAGSREWIADPYERYPWDLVEKASRVGLRTLAIPKEWGGGGAHCLEICLVGEEMAVGDLGVAVIFDQTWKISKLLYNMATDEQRQRFLRPFIEDDRFVLAVSMTEPNRGSDNVLPHVVPGAGLNTVAVRDGDHYVINGMKHFISNGSAAKAVIVGAKTDPMKSVVEGTSAFYVRQGTPGFTYGKVHEKIGQRLINNAELIFENLRIPDADRLGPENQFFNARRIFTRASNIEAAATTLGVGRAAFEEALVFANNRVEDGRPIAEQHSVGFMLADMALKIELARNMLWKAAWAVDHAPTYDPKLAWFTKIYCSEASFDVCRLALEVCGRQGIMTEYPFEKYLRDSSTFLHSDGTNQVMRLRIMNSLVHELRGQVWDTGLAAQPARA